MTIVQYLSLAGLAFGTYAGLYAIIAPDRIARSLRLQADMRKPGGYAEFRSTFGGVFFMIHAAAIVIMFAAPAAIAAHTVAPIAAAWYGAAIFRCLSMALDKEKNGEGGINRYWVLLEIFMGTLIGAPMWALLL